MNKKLLFFLCSIISFCYAAEGSKVPVEIGRNAFDWCSVQNAKHSHPLEDLSIAWNMPQQGYMLGVFDGHAGSEVAHYVGRNIHLKLSEYLNQAFTIKQSFEHAFSDIEEHVVNTFSGGSTAALVYISKGIAHIVHIGDSRVVFGNNNAVTFATQDHTLKREDERERVLKAEGIISREKRITGQALGPWRINGLAPSRTLGDAWAKGRSVHNGLRGIGGVEKVLLDGKYVKIVAEEWPDTSLNYRQFYRPQVGQVIAEVEYTERQLTGADRWAVIASDGLWDVVSNEEVVATVQDYSNNVGGLCGIASFLCQYAITRGSKDDITVIVVDLLNDFFKKQI